MLKQPNRIAVGFDLQWGVYVMAAPVTNVSLKYYQNQAPVQGDTIAYRVSKTPDFTNSAWELPLLPQSCQVTDRGGAYLLCAPEDRLVPGPNIFPPVIYSIIKYQAPFGERLTALRASHRALPAGFFYQANPNDTPARSMLPATKGGFGSRRLAVCVGRQLTVYGHTGVFNDVLVPDLPGPYPIMWNPHTNDPNVPGGPKWYGKMKLIKVETLESVPVYMNHVFNVNSNGILQMYVEEPDPDWIDKHRFKADIDIAKRTGWFDFAVVQGKRGIKLDPDSPIAACMSSSPLRTPIVVARTHDKLNVAIFVNTGATGNFLNDWIIVVPGNNFPKKDLGGAVSDRIGNSVAVFPLRSGDDIAKKNVVMQDAVVYSTREGRLAQVVLRGKTKDDFIVDLTVEYQELTDKTHFVDPLTDSLSGNLYPSWIGAKPERSQRIFVRATELPLGGLGFDAEKFSYAWNCYLCDQTLNPGYDSRGQASWLRDHRPQSRRRQLGRAVAVRIHGLSGAL